MTSDSFVAKGGSFPFSTKKNERKFCSHQNSPNQCNDDSIWFTLKEFVKFKALGKEVICSYYSEKYKFKGPTEVGTSISKEEILKHKEQMIVYYIKH